MSADVRTWLERLRGHGRSQVCTLEPKDCRELADVVAQLMADLENELANGPTAEEWARLQRELQLTRIELDLSRSTEKAAVIENDRLRATFALLREQGTR
jgi:hypothetical protein